jgi:hypothetical protein
MVSKTLILSATLVVVGFGLLVAAAVGWGSTQQCVPPSCPSGGSCNSPELCWSNPNPDPAYAGITFVVAGLGAFASFGYTWTKARQKARVKDASTSPAPDTSAAPRSATGTPEEDHEEEGGSGTS